VITRLVRLAALVALVALAAGCSLESAPWRTPLSPPTSPAASAEPTDVAEPTESPLVQKNRNERVGPSWSPADLEGPDGELLELGNVEPGAFGVVRAGEKVKAAVDAGYFEEDPKRGKACEGGPFFKWRGQWSGGMDVIVHDGTIQSLGLSKDSPETAEGISVNNSYGALKETYGDRLSEPVTMFYDQPGVFLHDGDRWLGFLLDASPETLNDKSRIVFLEVSVGNRPGLLRDGC
jgi:hypothetical protein